MKYPALFLLATGALLGCVGGSPENGAVVLQYRKFFEAGRRSESNGNVKIAEDTYGWLIGRDCRYGEYGFAMLQLHRNPDSQEAIKLLLSCARRSSHRSGSLQESAMDSAFSVAAMVKLSDVAVSRYDRPDIAAAFYCMISDIITPQVRVWADEMKADADYATIYGDLISAVKSSCQSREHAKKFTWDEIDRVLLNSGAGNVEATTNGRLNSMEFTSEQDGRGV